MSGWIYTIAGVFAVLIGTLLVHYGTAVRLRATTGALSEDGKKLLAKTEDIGKQLQADSQKVGA